MDVAAHDVRAGALIGELEAVESHRSAMVTALGAIVAVLTVAVCVLVVGISLAVADARRTTRDNNQRIVEMACAMYVVHHEPPPSALDC